MLAKVPVLCCTTKGISGNWDLGVLRAGFPHFIQFHFKVGVKSYTGGNCSYCLQAEGGCVLSFLSAFFVVSCVF